MRDIQILAAIAALSLFPSTAYASSCDIMTAEKASENAELIFIGKVDKVQYKRRGMFQRFGTDALCGEKTTHFIVTKAYQGVTIGETIQLKLEDGCMGLGGYQVKDEVLMVYANKENKVGSTAYTSSICQRMSHVSDNGGHPDIAYLDEKFLAATEQITQLNDQ